VKKLATIKDVAREAGVSVTTVSNLLNGRERLMLPATSARVREVMDSLGYRPSRLAQQLRAGGDITFGLVVPSVANPFWGSWAAHLEAAALAHGRQVYLCNSDRDPERERGYVDQLRADGVECVVLSTSLQSLDHLRPAIDNGLRLIAFDRERQPGDPEGLLSVSVDNEEGARLATQHLIDLGHRRIGFVSGSITTVSRHARFAGYRRALSESGIGYEEGLVLQSQDLEDSQSSAFGRAGTRDLLAQKNPPTAIVTTNDMFALGAYAGIRDAGRDVPDVSVVGFDDIPMSGFLSPTLTTVRQPLKEMAETVLQLILGEPVTRSTVFAPTLVVRESSGAPRPASVPAARHEESRNA
jgi:DNA-binding LacI/PurR family transcriptional regulator